MVDDIHRIWEKGSSKQEIEMSRRPVLTNQQYWKKSEAELRFIIADAGEAAINMRGFDEVAEAKYLDQANDAATVLYFTISKQINNDRCQSCGE
jgi:hypothetical protein